MKTKKLKAANKALLVFQITDNSAGLPQSAANTYFSPEEYEKNQYLQGRPSAMLRMALANGVAELLGGKILVRSSVGSGVEFFMTLKAVISATKTNNRQSLAATYDATYNATDNKGAQATVTTEEYCANLLSGARALLVDDNETNTMVLEGFLAQYALKETVSVTSGADALAILEQREFDLIFMDIQMPNIDGIKATKMIRKMSNSNAKIPIIAVSASSRIVNDDVCKSAGMNGYVEKPVKEADLLAAIQIISPRVKRRASHIAA